MEKIGTQIYLVTANDSNIHGTVFGGKVMEWADLSASFVAKRYADAPVLTASLDRIDFLAPIQVGEEAHMTPRLLFASAHTMYIQVDIESVNPFTGVKRQTGSTVFSFVGLDPKTKNIIKLPRLSPAVSKTWSISADTLKKYQALHLERKKLRKSTRPEKSHQAMEFLGTNPAKSIESSIVENHHLVMPGDQNTIGLLFAGRYLAWVDIIGSLAARRHCESPVVTANIEEVIFKQRVPMGSTLRLVAKPIFASKHSVQIQVSGWMWGENLRADLKVADAYLTFVALHNKTKRAKAIPNLSISTPKEKMLFLEGQARYLKSRSSQRAKRK